MIDIQNFFRENMGVVLLTLLVLIFLLYLIIRKIILIIEEHKKDKELFEKDIFNPSNEDSLYGKRDSAYKIIKRKEGK